MPAKARGSRARRGFPRWQSPYRLRRQGGQQRRSTRAEHRMTPVRRDIGERGQDKTPLMRARVRQYRVGRGAAQTVEIDDIEIEGPRRIGRAADTAEPRLDRLQRGQQHLRRDAAGEAGDAVDIGRLAGRRDRRGLVPRRGRDQRQPRQRRDGGERALASEPRRHAARTRQISSDRDQNHRRLFAAATLFPHSFLRGRYGVSSPV